MVFTSKPFNGVKTSLINSAKNIEGQEKAQYIVEKIHHIDPATMNVIECSTKAAQFYIENQQTLQSLIEKIING